MILYESDVVDAMLDYLQGGEEPPVTMDQLAPEADGKITDDIEYDPSEDPEMTASNGSGYMGESFAPTRIAAKRMQEKASNADLVAQYLDSTDNYTYDGLASSEFAPPNLTPAKAVIILKNLIAAGNSKAQKMLDVVKPAKQAGGGGAGGGKKTFSAYERKPTGNISKQLQSFIDTNVNVKTEQTAEDLYETLEDMVDAVMENSGDTPHLLISGDPGIGKTYTVQQAINKYAPNGKTEDGRRMFYVTGDIGASMLAIVPFFYFHSQDEIIVLDDNDPMIMNNQPQSVQNMMKAILDPKAGTVKPITVKNNMRKMFGGQYQNMLDDEANAKGKAFNGAVKRKRTDEGHLFEIDEDKLLNEGIFSLKIDGNLICEEVATKNDVAKLVESMSVPGSKNRLLEAKKAAADDDEFDDEEIEDDDGLLDTDDDNAGGESQFPSAFFFNSQVIFISNLVLDQISPAVADRCAQVEICLTAQQFMDRLAGIYPKLAQARAISKVSPALRMKIKKTVFECMQLVVQAFDEGIPLLDTEIEFSHKLTFRKFTDYVDFFILKYTRASKGGLIDLANSNPIPAGDINDVAYYNKVCNAVSTHLIRHMIQEVNK